MSTHKCMQTLHILLACVYFQTKLVGTVTAAKGTMLRPHVLVAVGNGKGLVGRSYKVNKQ